jgi:hypothetical protein
LGLHPIFGAGGVTLRPNPSKNRTPRTTDRSCSSRLGSAPLGVVALLGCCVTHALLVGGIAATSIALFGVPAIVISAAVVWLWWGRHRR